MLVSGNGSNLQAIIDQINEASLDATICAVISDNADAYGLVRAQQQGIPAIQVIPEANQDRTDYDRHLQSKIDELQPDWIILAGFMRILSDNFVNHYLGRLINIHPSLLPKYKGLDTHQRVLDAGDKTHGASVHFVTPKLDDGPVIMQASLAVKPDETASELKQRTHELEHQLYPHVIGLLCRQRIVYTGDMIMFDHVPISKPLTLDH